MSKRHDVLKAVKALVKAALPHADVVGLDGDSAAPSRIAPGGRAVMRSGDPGDPEIDLSPLSYNYQHRIPLELTAPPGTDPERAVDLMAEAIGGVLETNRTLGGLCEWLEPTTATTEDLYVEGAPPPKGADFMIIASYSTPNPLT